MRRWFLAMLAAASAALWSAPAAAAEPGVCIQEKLAARALYTGPIDGVIGPALTTAALSFAGTTSFPMPALTAATTAEWCAVLSGWERRGASPFPDRPGLAAAVAPYRNPDPAALPVGIRFRADVPTATRKIILDDLSWLGGLGTLKESDHLTTLLGLPRMATGADLLAWFVQRIQAIGTSSGTVCPRRELVLAAAGGAWATGESFNLNCTVLPEGADAFVDIPTAGADPGIGRIVWVGDEVMLSATARETAPMVNVVVDGNDGRAFGPGAKTGSVEDRIYRLSVLAHEAFHTIADDDDHYDCSDFDYVFNDKFKVGYFGAFGGAAPPASDCDIGFKAYAAEAFILETLGASCDCTDHQRNNILLWSVERAAESVVPLRSAWTFPDHPDLRASGLIGRRMTDLPIQPFFDLQMKLAEGAAVPSFCSGIRCQRTVAEARALSAIVRDAFANSPGKFRLEWTVPKSEAMALDTDWALAWLERSRRAVAAAYNVPLLWVRSCAATPMGCESDWLRAIPQIQPGVQSARYKLASASDGRVLSVKLPAAWMSGRETREVRLSVQESDGKPLTALLQCGDRYAIFELARPNRDRQGFSSRDCYVGVMTDRDTQTAEFSVLVDLATNPPLGLAPAPPGAPLAPAARRPAGPRQGRHRRRRTGGVHPPCVAKATRFGYARLRRAVVAVLTERSHVASGGPVAFGRNVGNGSRTSVGEVLNDVGLAARADPRPERRPAGQRWP